MKHGWVRVALIWSLLALQCLPCDAEPDEVTAKIHGRLQQYRNVQAMADEGLSQALKIAHRLNEDQNLKYRKFTVQVTDTSASICNRPSNLAFSKIDPQGNVTIVVCDLFVMAVARIMVVPGTLGHYLVTGMMTGEEGVQDMVAAGSYFANAAEIDAEAIVLSKPEIAIYPCLGMEASIQLIMHRPIESCSDFSGKEHALFLKNFQNLPITVGEDIASRNDYWVQYHEMHCYREILWYAIIHELGHFVFGEQTAYYSDDDKFNEFLIGAGMDEKIGRATLIEILADKLSLQILQMGSISVITQAITAYWDAMRGHFVSGSAIENAVNARIVSLFYTMSCQVSTMEKEQGSVDDYSTLCKRFDKWVGFVRNISSNSSDRVWWDDGSEIDLPEGLDHFSPPKYSRWPQLSIPEAARRDPKALVDIKF